jgi:hypothetical protein
MLIARIACVLLLCGASLLAADVAGVWTGSFQITRDDGSVRDDTAHLNLKQEGQTITGTAGPNPDQQFPISNGRLEGDKLTFTVLRDNDPPIQFTLVVDGKTITGTANGEREGRKMHAKLVVKKSD